MSQYGELCIDRQDYQRFGLFLTRTSNETLQRKPSEPSGTANGNGNDIALLLLMFANSPIFVAFRLSMKKAWRAVSYRIWSRILSLWRNGYLPHLMLLVRYLERLPLIRVLFPRPPYMYFNRGRSRRREYLVDEIIDSRLREGTTGDIEYLVAFNRAEPSWKPVRYVLPGCAPLMAHFHHKFPEKPGPSPGFVAPIDWIASDPATDFDESADGFVTWLERNSLYHPGQQGRRHFYTWLTSTFAHCESWHIVANMMSAL